MRWMLCEGVWGHGSYCGNAGLDIPGGHHAILSALNTYQIERCVPSLRVLTLQFLFLYVVYVTTGLCGCLHDGECLSQMPTYCQM